VKLIDEYNLIWEQYESYDSTYIYIPIFGDAVRTEGTRSWGGDGEETPAEDPLKYIGNTKRFIVDPNLFIKQINEFGFKILETCCYHDYTLVYYHTQNLEAACYMKISGDVEKILSIYDNTDTDIDYEYSESPSTIEGGTEIKNLEKEKQLVKPFSTIEQMVEDFNEYLKIIKKDYKEPKQEPSDKFWDRKIHQAVQMDKIKNKKWDGD
jgi:hypothetical protein